MTSILIAVVMALPPAVGVAEPVQTFVEAPGPMGPLKGTMLSPAGAAAPVVLIIPGSGPTDRDGNSPLGVKSSTYRLLAQALAEKDIASVRIDKRGMFASSGAVADANGVTIDAYAADVHAWIAAITKLRPVRCVWLLGHSEGGLVALKAAQNAEGVCGLILVSTPGRRLGEILREQLRANPANAPLLDQANAAISTLEAGRHLEVSTLNPVLQPLFAAAVQDFLIDMMSVDPATLIAAYDGPVLIVQGDRDIQVGVADAERLKHANARAQLDVLPNINHVLKSVRSDERGPNVATYADPSLPVGPGVVEAIAAFATTKR